MKTPSSKSPWRKQLRWRRASTESDGYHALRHQPGIELECSSTDFFALTASEDAFEHSELVKTLKDIVELEPKVFPTSISLVSSWSVPAASRSSPTDLFALTASEDAFVVCVFGHDITPHSNRHPSATFESRLFESRVPWSTFLGEGSIPVAEIK